MWVISGRPVFASISFPRPELHIVASTALQMTPLHEVHRQAGAKMVDFAGWSMPLHYGSQIDEHRRVRADAGMFDVSHMLAVDVCGANAAALLRRVLANDVARLAPGAALYSCMLADDGGILDDVIAYRCDTQDFRLVVNAGTAARDVEWLQQQAESSSSRVGIAPRRDLAIVAVQGPHAREKTWAVNAGWRSATEGLARFEAVAVNAETWVARTGYTGEDGFEIMLPAPRAVALWSALGQAGVAPAGLAARDSLRLEAGMNLYGQDMDESVTPFECGLGWTVQLQGERDFIGRRALEERPVRFDFAGLVLEDRGVMRAHQPVFTPAGDGVITSGGFSPVMGRSIALARVPRGVEPGAAIAVGVRDKRIAARAVRPPFVRAGRVLV